MNKIFELDPVFCESNPDILEYGKLYVIEPYQTAKHLCPCGCGEIVVFEYWSGQEWTIALNSKKQVSFTPSVGNCNFKCKSHYYIKNNKIDWLN